MHILLTGATGQVGIEFLRQGAHLGVITAALREQCDISDPEAVRRLMRSVRPDVIVNAAAYTAVDKAESEPEICFAVNAITPGVLAEEAQQLGALLIHYSTDYVFDGTKTSPYSEDDPPCPISEYGRSKLEGERRILATNAQAIILRTSWVYSTHGKNFLLTILRLAQQRSELRIVADQFGSPTSALAIASATARIIAARSDKNPGGVYHMTALGLTSWFGFARAIVQRAGLLPPPTVIPIQTEDYPTPARRPANSALSNNKFSTTFGFRLRSWEEDLTDVMLELKPEAASDSSSDPLHQSRKVIE